MFEEESPLVFPSEEELAESGEAKNCDNGIALMAGSCRLGGVFPVGVKGSKLYFG